MTSYEEMDVDSQDDFMIIDSTEASSEARRKWTEIPTTPKANSEDIEIKMEPQSTSVPVEVLSAREAQMRIKRQELERVKKNEASNPSDHATPTVPEPDVEQSQGETRQDNTDGMIKEKISINAVDHNPDDDSWMEQGGDDGDHDELQALRLLEESLEARQSAGELPFDEMVELMKIKAKIADIEKRHELRQRHEKMFVSEDEDDHENGDVHENEDSRRRTYGLDEDGILAQALSRDFEREANEENARSIPPRAKNTSTKKRRVGKNAREVEEIRRSREREKAQKRKVRQAAKSAKVNGTTDGPGKGHGRKRNSKNPPKKNYRSRMNSLPPADTLRAMMDDLAHNDAIVDQTSHGITGDAPQISETANKERQLMALMASIPNDMDTHRGKADMKDLHMASRSFGRAMVKPNNGKWSLKGLKSPLYHHQLLGAHWMVGRELSSSSPKGGLLADAMGIGKTVEMLATMVGNPPSKADLKFKRKATLIVLPSSAIKQWNDEICKHAEKDFFRMVIQYRARTEISPNVLQECDIVLTSYATVMASFPWPNKEQMKALAESGGMAAWTAKAQGQLGALHQVDWYRVVLDEAHAIKNYRVRTSVACQNLQGRYRWAMSGTPIQNRLEELFPYFRFLRVDWTQDFKQFYEHFCDPNADAANARVTVLLSIVMMRRTLKDKILGRAIVDLPPSHPTTKYVCFSKQERALYRLLETRFRDVLNDNLAAGTAERNYNVFMVQLLRLRQCTAHPFLLEQTIRDLFTSKDVQFLSRQLKSLGKSVIPIYEQTRQWVQSNEDERTAAGDIGHDAVDRGERVPFGRSEFGKYFKMDKILQSLHEKKLPPDQVVCGLCGDFPREGQITHCEHIFCKECLENHLHEKAAENDSSDCMVCPVCKVILRDLKPYKDLTLRDDEDGEEGRRSGSSQPKGKQHQTGRGVDMLNNVPRTARSEWLQITIEQQDSVLPSAKAIELKAQVLAWMTEAPDDKILIFTQFRMMAKVIGMIAEAEKWGFLYYTGDMNQTQRHEAVRRFHVEPECHIMIAGLKCGGQALNLTCANRVISIDVWFNHCVEQQAFGRVFRIGQHKETYFNRIVVRDSVDQRLLDLQAEKVNLIDRAMQDDGRAVTPLSMLDLASLFGHLVTDERGRPHVEPDYREDGEPEPEPASQV